MSTRCVLMRFTSPAPTSAIKTEDMHVSPVSLLYVYGHAFVQVDGLWNIADCVERAFDLEQMSVGSVGGGRIGQAVLRRLKAFDCNLHYADRHRLPHDVESSLGLTYHSNVESLVKECDVITINCPLHPETEYLFNKDMISKMKRGTYLVNTARGKICDADAVADAVRSGQLAGYAGDVWFPQPAPKDHPWRRYELSLCLCNTLSAALAAVSCSCRSPATDCIGVRLQFQHAKQRHDPTRKWNNPKRPG